jgi:signal transduction histidine kinase/ActR/RegA family two-component response regulator
VTGSFGFLLAINPGNVTAVWPPSGVAFAAALLLRWPAWIGIWIGSFAVNMWFFTNVSHFSILAIMTAGMIATGSTLQAVLGSFVLRRCIDANDILRRPQDSFTFVVTAAASCLLAATIGVTALSLSGFVDWRQYGYTWLTWWAGDTGGVLVYTPLIMTWRSLPSFHRNYKRMLEFLLFLCALCFACQIVFNGLFLGKQHYPLHFLVFPFLLWAAGRFGVCGVTLTITIVELFAIIGLKNGYGPFALNTLNESLLMLAAFIATFTLIGLAFASVLTAWQSLRQKLENIAEEQELKVTQRTADLEEANRSLCIARDRAIEASAIKSAFVANISHELRTPLSGILGMTELVLAHPLGKDLRDMIQTVHDSGNALLKVVSDILDLSKIEAGKVMLEYEPFSPAFLVQDCTKLLAPAAVDRKLKLNTSLDSQLPQFVYGDASRIRQVLVNLIGNAIKFTQQGGIIVSADIENETQDTITIRFVVKDTGIGIADENKELLFAPFVQLDASTTRKFGGTGLGLAISKRFIEMMNGQIGLESALGSGSMFWFKIPFDKSRPHQTEGGKQDKHSIPAVERLPETITLNRRVLVVEDNLVLSGIIIQQLAILGMLAGSAGTGRDAITAYKTGEYDLIFMDINLPDITGYAVTADIRALERNAGISDGNGTPIIALTAGAMDGDREKALAAGLDDYMAKPVSIDQLRVMLIRWLSRKQSPSCTST